MSLNGLALATSIAAAVAASNGSSTLQEVSGFTIETHSGIWNKSNYSLSDNGHICLYIHKFTIVRMGLGTVAGVICFLITVITSTVIYIAVCYLLSIPEIKAI